MRHHHDLFSDYHWQKAGDSRHRPGIQTFGDYSKWQQQVYALVADGLFTETRYFYVMPKVAIRHLAQLSRASVLKVLKDEGRIDETLIKKLLA